MYHLAYVIPKYCPACFKTDCKCKYKCGNCTKVAAFYTCVICDINLCIYCAHIAADGVAFCYIDAETANVKNTKKALVCPRTEYFAHINHKKNFSHKCRDCFSFFENPEPAAPYYILALKWKNLPKSIIYLILSLSVNTFTERIYEKN